MVTHGNSFALGHENSPKSYGAKTVLAFRLLLCPSARLDIQNDWWMSHCEQRVRRGPQRVILQIRVEVKTTAWEAVVAT